MEKEDWNTDCPRYLLGELGEDCYTSECFFQDYFSCPFYQDYLKSLWNKQVEGDNTLADKLVFDEEKILRS